MAKTITRQTLKLFGKDGASSNFGQFGSQAAGSAVNTKAIATIQGLAAWLNGWQDAVAAGEAPYLQDMNALIYVMCYSIAYQFQDGIADWDAGTSYYIGSLVRRVSTSEIYSSKVDDNLNQALPTAGTSDSNWQFVSGVISSNYRISGPLAMNSQKVTGLAAATASGDALRYEQLIYIQAPVIATTTTVVSTTSSTYQSTNISASITPRNSSSRVKITVSGTFQIGATIDTQILISLFRGATDLNASGNGFAENRNQDGSVCRGTFSFCYIDSPASGSAVTYTVKIKSPDNTTSVQVPSGDQQLCVIILEEVV